MKVYNIPCYVDWGNGTNAQLSYCLACSTNVINTVLQKINHSGINVTFEDWSGLTEPDPAAYINEYFNDNVLSPYIKYYRVKVSSEPDHTTHKPEWDYFENVIKMLKLNYTEVINDTDSAAYTGIDLLNGEHLTGGILSNTSLTSGLLNVDFRNVNTMYADNFVYISTETGISLTIFPDDLYIDGHINPDMTDPTKRIEGITLSINIQTYSDKANVCNGIRLSGRRIFVRDYIRVNSLNNTAYVANDSNNPYTSSSVSAMGGADGTLNPGILDSVDKATIPELPSISACDLGFITIYNPSASELRQLSQFMWSGAFDLATYKKLFADPMQSIIGLAVVPVNPSIGGSKNVMFGSIDSGISMSYLSSNWTQLDCGWVDIDKYIGSFMDYAPYTKISIYLPFIGIRDLSADDIMGGSIHVVYNIDVLTGACAAFVEHSSKGVLYSYNGSCITNIPLTSENFSGAIQNAVSAVISGIGTIAGMATGAAPITAMGVAGLMNSAANTALNSKPQIQRSGNLGGSAGILSILTPYVMIERPNVSVPDNVENFAGQCSNITMRLGSCKGFTMCEFVHLHDVAATSDEIAEIEGMLKAGVIL